MSTQRSEELAVRILGHGAYSLAEAARLARLKPGRVRDWFRGRAARVIGTSLFRGDYRPIKGDFAISFHDLIELVIAGQLREQGVSLQHLRKVYRQLQSDFGERHPFCRRELLVSDAKRLFTRGLDEGGREQVIEILTRQRCFPRIILPFLKQIDYDGATQLARRWLVAPKIVLDPRINYGKPVVEAVGLSTGILAAAYHANDQDAGLVARWYGVEREHVLAAAAFEDGLAA